MGILACELFHVVRLQFRGQKIWQTEMQELLFREMQKANQVYHLSNSILLMKKVSMRRKILSLASCTCFIMMDQTKC
ncbi:hypothetical protein AAZX31_16G077100 [Glycine max]